MNTEDSAAWKWMLGGRYLGFTLTFTHAVTPEELLRRYGADPAAARFLPFAGIDAALEPGPNDAILRVGMLQEWAFGIEILGFKGTVPAALAQISQATRTIAVHMGANALHTVDYWVDGRPREKFEPGVASTLRAAGPHPFWDATERHRARRPDAGSILAVMRAAEDHIGGYLPVEVDDGPLLSVILPQVLPPPPSPVPPLPLVNPTQPRPLGRHLGSLQVPERPKDGPGATTRHLSAPLIGDLHTSGMGKRPTPPTEGEEQ
jgi:hypothetical protein